MKLREPYGLFAVSRQSALAKAGYTVAVGINLSPGVVDYFKRLAEETGLPYQKLIDLYLLDCARKRRHPRTNRVGGHWFD